MSKDKTIQDILNDMPSALREELNEYVGTTEAKALAASIDRLPGMMTMDDTVAIILHLLTKQGFVVGIPSACVNMLQFWESYAKPTNVHVVVNSEAKKAFWTTDYPALMVPKEIWEQLDDDEKDQAAMSARNSIKNSLAAKGIAVIEEKDDDKDDDTTTVH